MLGRFVPWFDFRSSVFLLFAQCLVATLVAALSLWARRTCAVGARTSHLTIWKIFQDYSRMNDPLVSIILRSYNEGWALRDTLPALRAQD